MLPSTQLILCVSAHSYAPSSCGMTFDRDGKTALMLAAFEGHTATVQTLLANDVQVNTQAKDGATALMLAAARGHTDVVTALLAKGADVNLQHNTGQTALMLAVVGGHGLVTHTLLAQGADLALKNRAGQTAVTLAQARGMEHLLRQNPQTQGQVSGEVALDPQLPSFGRYHALVIGNNAYEYLPIAQGCAECRFHVFYHACGVLWPLRTIVGMPGPL